MKFVVVGARKDTGKEIRVAIEARDQAQVEAWAAKNGVMWTSIEPQTPAAPLALPPTAPVAPAAAPMRAPLAPLASAVAIAPAGKAYVISRDTVVGIIMIVAVGLALLLTDQHLGFSSSAEFGQTTGAAIAYFLLIYLLGYIGAKIGGKIPKRARIGFAIGAAIIPLLMAVNEFGVRRRQMDDLTSTAHSLASQVRSNLTTAPAGSTAPSPSGEAAPDLSKLTGSEAADAKVMLGMLQGFFTDAKKLGDAYTANIAKIASGGLIQPAQLDSSEKIAAAKAKLTQLSALVEAHQKDCDALFTSLPQRVSQLNISEAMKGGFVEGAQKGLGKTRDLLNQLTAQDRQFVIEGQSLADFMKSRLGHFEVKNGKALFENAADVAQFNAINGRIHTIVTKEMALTQEAQAMGRQSADALDQMFKPK